MENPLLTLQGKGNDSYVPFDTITSEHFEPAFEVAFAEARANLEKIITADAEPTFENTIEAIEYCAEHLRYVSDVFSNLKEAHTNPEITRIAEVVMPQLAAFSNDLLLNEIVFARVKKVFESKPVLSTEEHRLLERTYQSFVRQGALLSPVQKEILRTYDAELAGLSEKFASNVLAATNAYTLIIRDEKDLAGLPERVQIAAKEEALERGIVDGWVFTLKMTSYGPFMQYADNAKLREEISLAYSTRAMSGEYDNRAIVLRIAEIRRLRAQLLGFATHADFVLSDRMARTPEAVAVFSTSMYEAAHSAAQKDIESIRVYKEKLTGESILQSWDVGYFSEKMQTELFQYNEEDVRPYLQLETVIEGVFMHAKRLYGLEVVERKDVPVFHPDVKVYDVSTQAGEYVGLVYMDLFPRASKRAGAWIESLRMQHRANGVNVRPQMIIVGSFTKPTEGVPSLISEGEAKTLFHEFGHALHNLLSQCTYKTLAGFNTLWDFVELPSQFMDRWFKEKESLQLYAKHYQTGEPIPEMLVDKMVRASTFLAGLGLNTQLRFGALDMAWHGSEIPETFESFEEKISAPYMFFSTREGAGFSVGFKHIFAGGYDAGYYSYLWSEVLAADAFEYFKQNGLFNRAIAEKFREHVLSKGNTEDPMVLYKRFRGQEPDPKALLRQRGIL